MKRSIIAVISGAVILIIAAKSIYMKSESGHKKGEPDVVGTFSVNRDENLTVVANRENIEDREAFARELLQMYKVSTVAGKKYAYYLCSTNKETKRCSSHRIPEKDLEDAVLVMLKQHIQNILHLKRVLEFIGTVPFQEINMKKLQDRMEKKKQEKERCKELRMMLYSDMKEGIVSKEDYVELHAAYGKRLRNAEESIRAIQKEMDNELEKADKANTWLDYFVKYQDIEELSRTVVVELIRQIRVYDKKNIEITFDFDDCYQTLLNQLPAMGVDTVIDDDNNLQVKVKEVV